MMQLECRVMLLNSKDLNLLGSGHGICAKGHDVSSFHWNVHSLSEAHPMYFHIFSLYFPTDGIKHAQTRWLRNPMILEAWIPRKCVLWSGHHTRPLQSQLPSQRLVISLGCNSKTLSSSWTHWELKNKCLAKKLRTCHFEHATGTFSQLMTWHVFCSISPMS